MGKSFLKIKFISRSFHIHFDIDENYYYVTQIGGGSNPTVVINSNKNKNKTLSIHRIKHDETKVDYFNFEPKPPYGDGKQKYINNPKGSSIIQEWKLLFIRDNKIYLKDDFPNHKDENKNGFIKMAVVSIDGKILAEADLITGHKIGNFNFNPSYDYKNKDKIYTFVLTDTKPTSILYRCYDLNLKLLWEKNYDLNTVITTSNNINVFQNFDQSLTIQTYNGYFHIDNNGNNPTFKKPYCLGNDYERMKLNCYLFEKATKLNKSIVQIDAKKYPKGEMFHGEYSSVFLYKIKDKVVYAFSVDMNGVFYRLASFNFKE